jgi:mannose-6-phosphate isomerase-like protein (cupin superfamily)
VADPIICREHDRNADLVMHKAADRAASNKFFSLAKGKNDRNMEPFFVMLNPEPEEDRKLSSHEGEEFILVNSGSMLLVYGDETYTLETGDTVYYNSIVPHYAGAAGGKPATIHAVIYYPR